MNSTILHGISPTQLQEIIELAIERKLKTPTEKHYISKRKAAQLLNRTVQTLDAWHRAGILRKKHIGGRVFYDANQVESLITNTK
ncbi:MAG: hypothetical protein DRJ05_05370 [Bacteroidetes bacterium]|nr:MAG: hypothetical protein DRJ05_05370 [Bacteroidota bacterium]